MWGLKVAAIKRIFPVVTLHSSRQGLCLTSVILTTGEMVHLQLYDACRCGRVVRADYDTLWTSAAAWHSRLFTL